MEHIVLLAKMEAIQNLVWQSYLQFFFPQSLHYFIGGKLNPKV